MASHLFSQLNPLRIFSQMFPRPCTPWAPTIVWKLGRLLPGPLLHATWRSHQKPMGFPIDFPLLPVKLLMKSLIMWLFEKNNKTIREISQNCPKKSTKSLNFPAPPAPWAALSSRPAGRGRPSRRPCRWPRAATSFHGSPRVKVWGNQWETTVVYGGWLSSPRKVARLHHAVWLFRREVQRLWKVAIPSAVVTITWNVMKRSRKKAPHGQLDVTVGPVRNRYVSAENQ